MSCCEYTRPRPNKRAFLAGLLALIALFTLLAYAPPPRSTVSRNLEQGIDATPLIYSESDRQPELERALAEDMNRRSPRQ